MPDFDKRKIFWHSRRGMLELDLLLVPFTTDQFDNLSNQEQVLYVELLEEEDQDLFSRFLERVQPPQEKFKPLISKILAHKASEN